MRKMFANGQNGVDLCHPLHLLNRVLFYYTLGYDLFVLEAELRIHVVVYV